MKNFTDENWRGILAKKDWKRVTALETVNDMATELNAIIQESLDAEIVETTFRSRFRFHFLKYPLFKKVVSFWVPETLTVVSFCFSVILKYPL